MSETLKDNDILKELLIAVKEYKINAIEGLVDRALNAKIPASKIKMNFIQSLEDVRKQLMSNNYSIPEFLLSVDSAMAGLNMLIKINPENEDRIKNATIVIGVVEGDPHDLGKNIIAGIFRVYGYHVIDLGKDVSTEVFIRSVKDNKAGILALSAMMSTTTINMKEIITEVKSRFPGTAIIAGGAFLNEKLAESYGADAYSETALTVIEETEKITKRNSK